MRRHLRALLTASLLACGAAPLVAIEYHAQGETLPDSTIGSAADPLTELEPQQTEVAASPSEPGLVESFCEDCCDCCCDWCGFDGIYRPRAWIVRADALWIQRNEPQGDVIVANDDLLFSANLLGPDDATCYDVSLMELNPHGNGKELRYMELGTLSETVELQIVDPVIFTTPVTDQITGLNNVTIDYESDLQSAELHWLWAKHYGTWMFGVRYLALDEELLINTAQVGVAAPLLTFTSFSTSNDAVGLQLGFGTMFFEHNCWRLQWVGKASVYYNEVDSNVVFDSNAGVSNLGAEATEELAAAGESRLTLIYQFSPGWAFRSGLEFLFIDGVGLATEQIPTTENVITNDSIDTDINLGTVYYYGAFLGLEYNF